MPAPNPNPPTVIPETVELVVDFDGTVIWNGTPVDRGTMQAYFAGCRAERTPQPEIHVSPNRLAKYDAVARVLADAQRQGATHIGFTGIDQYQLGCEGRSRGSKRAATPRAFPFFREYERGRVMTASKLRAAATAILLGTAAVTMTAFAAQAATVSPRVGAALKEAQSLAAAGNYKAAMAKINEAEQRARQDGG